jgi:hypothetical protein
MTHSTHEHLEHAEHSQHAAHDALNRKVAMTMAIIAACLAVAAMVSHRGHTETLRLTTEANIYHTKANVYHTKSSDAWNYYQAKNILSRFYNVQLMEAKTEKAKKYLAGEIEKYKGTKSKEGELAKLKREAEKLGEEGEHAKHEAEHNEHLSHEVHLHVNWIDYGHLALDLALVLATITVLTKLRGFWYFGMAAAVVGVGLVLVGVLGLVDTGHF